MELADKANCLVLAMDAAEGIENPSPLEKMLTHQMAAAHRMAMKLMAKADSTFYGSMSQLDMNYANLIIGQATRLMNTYQMGLQTLAKVKNGGKQQVTVQHIQVSGDAQAVVTGKMDYPKQGLIGGGKDEK